MKHARLPEFSPVGLRTIGIAFLLVPAAAFADQSGSWYSGFARSVLDISRFVVSEPSFGSLSMEIDGDVSYSPRVENTYRSRLYPLGTTDPWDDKASFIDASLVPRYGNDSNPMSRVFPVFQAELRYEATYSEGQVGVWLDGELASTNECTRLLIGSRKIGCGGSKATQSRGIGIGGFVEVDRFLASGYLYESSNVDAAPVPSSLLQLGIEQTSNTLNRARDGFVVKGSYQFNEGTTINVIYGETSLERGVNSMFAQGIGANSSRQSVWTVGVYHDVASWMRLVAEINQAQTERTSALEEATSHSIGVGGMMSW